MASPTTMRNLPLLTQRVHQGGRSAMTCRYRCGDACAQPVPNRSDNEYFGDVVTQSLSRRTVLRAGAAGAALLGLTAWGPATPAAAVQPAHPGGQGFWPIDPVPADVDAVVVPEGFRWSPIISWGDPVTEGAPEFDFNAQSEEAQRGQAGYNCDYVSLVSTGDHHFANSSLLVFNNEYTNDELMFPDISSAQDLTDEQLRIIMAAHGMTVVEIHRAGFGCPWEYRRYGVHNRRVHTQTELDLDGPAAGHEALRTTADPTGTRVLGTLNNCAGGETPWGTVLSGEENFNQYFNATGAGDPDGKLARYGLDSEGRGWERIDLRFSVVDEPNEVNRFGWIVELDAEDQYSTPVKHTAMGRFKHEGATIALSQDGRAVAYMGDDERFDYMYKFVSKHTVREGRSTEDKRHNMTLLSEGDLYVAKFTGDGFEDGVCDGTGQWLPLVRDGESQVPGFTVEEVLIWTRQAADEVGPTKMDRPEDIEPHPTTGRVYAAMTNNTDRVPSQIDEANPRANNKHGHIMELIPDGDDHASTTFSWSLVVICGDPEDPSTYFAGYDKAQVSPISSPDNLAFDTEGHLWISTDGQPGTLDLCDGLFYMPVFGENRGRLHQFLSVPVGAECSGPVIHTNESSVIVAVQHPGEVDGATTDNVVSTFPYQGDDHPRPGVIHVYRG